MQHTSGTSYHSTLVLFLPPTPSPGSVSNIYSGLPSFLPLLASSPPVLSTLPPHHRKGQAGCYLAEVLSRILSEHVRHSCTLPSSLSPFSSGREKATVEV